MIKCNRNSLLFHQEIEKKTIKLVIRNRLDKKVRKILENKWKSVAKQLIINLTRKGKINIKGKQQTSQT